MKANPSQIALMASQLPPETSEAAVVPEWIHLLPSGDVATRDDRGPYTVGDLGAIIEMSFQFSDKLVVDLDHATDLAAPNGGPAPAVGWIVAMEVRENGIWGQVEWNRRGQELLADRAYRGISPVILVDEDDGNRVHAILRASLVNQPNLIGMEHLNAQQPEEKDKGMTLLQRLAKLAGLESDASEKDIMAALENKVSTNAEQGKAEQALSDIAEALDVAGDDPAVVTQAAKTAAGDTKALVPALQAQVKELSEELNALKDGGKKKDAEAFVDAAIAELRIGLNAENRNTFVEMHMENPERTEGIINGFPKANASKVAPAAHTQSETTGDSAKDLVAKAKTYQAEQQAAGTPVDWTTAVQHVAKEGGK